MIALRIWYQELANDVLSRRRIFAQIGSFHRTADFQSDVCDALVEAGLQPVTYPVDRLPARLDISALKPGSVVVVPDFEDALRLAHPERHLGLCRPALQKAGQAGASWLVISRFPESLYPSIDGSTVTIDSATHRMRPLTLEDLERVPDVSSKNLRVIMHFSGGSRAIAGGAIEVLSSSRERNEQIAEVKRITDVVLARSLNELGPDHLSWLERWVLERGMLAISTLDVAAAALFELRACGVGEVDPVADELNIFGQPLTRQWYKALDSALSDLVEIPPQWGSIVADLFFIERSLRRSLSIFLSQRYGQHWGEHLPDPLQARIIESFRRIASPKAKSIADVARPLDWVTFGDLFELVSKFSSSDRLQGLSSNEWRIIADSILPIRDRVSHMRLLRDGDRQVVRNVRWRITSASRN